MCRRKPETMGNGARLKFVLRACPWVFMLTVAFSFLTQHVGALLGFDFPDQTSINLVRRCAGWNWNFVSILVQVLILAPVLEELIFRGVLFKLSALGLRRVWTARQIVPSVAVLSSVLFSAAHYFKAPFPDNAFLALFFFGLAQCWIYRRTNAIWCAMLNHCLFNTTNLVLLFILPSPGVID